MFLDVFLVSKRFDILPCMAASPAGSLVDRLYLQQHDPSWGLEGTQQAMQTAIKGLRRVEGIEVLKGDLKVI